MKFPLKPIFQKLFYLIILNSICFNSNAQGWMWVHGNTAAPEGFGQAGVPDVLNTPGQSYARCTWTDLDGNLWAYGGGHISPTSTYCNGSDLWKYDILTNEWLMISGDFTSISAAMGVPGPQGVPTVGSNPGPAMLGQPRWIDDNGDLWLGGGGSMSDVMWRFDQVSQNWSWMSGLLGSQQPVNYGVQGVASSTNSPGRFYGEDNLNWKDELGNFWYYNLVDGTVWKYNPNTLFWTWMLGVPMSGPVYGTLGQASATNTPGVLTGDAKYGWMTWQDTSYNCYIGYARSDLANSPVVEYELWRLDISNLSWNCIYRSTLDNQNSTNNCVVGDEEKPIWGNEQRGLWVDDCGHMWTVQPNSYLHSLANEVGFWRYESDLERFTLIDRYSNRIFGTQGVRSTLNHPFHATAGAETWVSDGKFWTLEGTGSDNTVLWNYEPDKVTANFEEGVNCNEITFSDLSSSGCNRLKSWKWNFGDGHSSTDQNPIHTYEENGTYSVTLIVNNCTWHADTITKTITTGNCIEDEDEVDVIVSDSINEIDSEDFNVLLFVPNVFTPGQGANSIFLPELNDANDIYEYKLTVFNRWGEILFISQDPAVGWDGSYSGEIVPNGVYVWKIEYGVKINDQRIIEKGMVTLLR